MTKTKIWGRKSQKEKLGNLIGWMKHSITLPRFEGIFRLKNLRKFTAKIFDSYQQDFSKNTHEYFGKTKQNSILQRLNQPDKRQIHT